MTDPPRQKPMPARPATGDPRPDSAEPATPPPAVPQDRDVTVSGRGGTWRVSVLGRSGRAEARSAPLMLLGFSPDGPGADLEAMVAGRSLLELPREALESALMRALEPPAGGRRRPFFEDADGARGS